ncbi:hypothetical protein TWF718_000347 [Orbilia javanica]|uniref:Uncharacterized protein n=1 Tax=Orbilia javanica TaxID=47235 RepID=A0AAN8MTS4_9PEZI
MKSVKSIIKRPPTESAALGSSLEAPSKKRKSVSFAESPEKPSKRKTPATNPPMPRSKVSSGDLKKFTQSARRSTDSFQWHRFRNAAKSSLQAKPGESSKLPSQPSGEAKSSKIPEKRSQAALQTSCHSGIGMTPQNIEPFDPEKDWFTSMHVSVNCTENPVHVIGIKQNKDKRQCEGIEGLDERLLSGQVRIMFHPGDEKEPVCDTCWTKKKNGCGLEKYRDIEIDELELPGSWPKEVTEPPAHTHIYNIFYEGCKRRSLHGNRGQHFLKLVKGKEKYGGNGTMCRCPYIDKGPARCEGKGSAGPIITKIFMPVFAGCPGCEGRDLKIHIKPNHVPT